MEPIYSGTLYHNKYGAVVGYYYFRIIMIIENLSHHLTCFCNISNINFENKVYLAVLSMIQVGD